MQLLEFTRLVTRGSMPATPTFPSSAITVAAAALTVTQHVRASGVRFIPDLILRLAAVASGLFPLLSILRARAARGGTMRQEDLAKAATLLAQLLLLRRVLRATFDALRTNPIQAAKDLAGAVIRSAKTLPILREKVAEELATTVNYFSLSVYD